jgi:hypothetical protein
METYLREFIEKHGEELGLTSTAEEILGLEPKEELYPLLKDLIDMWFEKINVYMLCETMLTDSDEGIKTRQRLILLWGPPGCGKSHLVKATKNTFLAAAGKKIEFHTYKSGDIISIEKLRNAFDKAENIQPSILFFDEAEVLLSEAKQEIVSEFLQLVQGVETYAEESKILIVLASNKPWAIDPRVLSRVYTSLYIPLPPKQTIGAYWNYYLQHYLKGIDLQEIDYEYLVDHSKGIAPRNIEFVCSKLKNLCVFDKKQFITTTDIDSYLKEVQRETDEENYEEELKTYIIPTINREQAQQILQKNQNLYEILGINEDEVIITSEQTSQPLYPSFPGYDWYTIEESRYAEISQKDVMSLNLSNNKKTLRATIQLFDGNTVQTLEKDITFFIKPLLAKGIIRLPDSFLYTHRNFISSGRHKVKLEFENTNNTSDVDITINFQMKGGI